MADAICEFPLRIGLFGIGLDAYWPQFAGLRERFGGLLTSGSTRSTTVRQ